MVDLISGEVEKGAVLWLGSFLKGWSNVNSEWSGVEGTGRNLPQQEQIDRSLPKGGGMPGGSWKQKVRKGVLVEQAKTEE